MPLMVYYAHFHAVGIKVICCCYGISFLRVHIRRSKFLVWSMPDIGKNIDKTRLSMGKNKVLLRSFSRNVFKGICILLLYKLYIIVMILLLSVLLGLL